MHELSLAQSQDGIVLDAPTIRDAHALLFELDIKILLAYGCGQREAELEDSVR